MSDISNVRCKACVTGSYGQESEPHVEGCPYAPSPPIDRAAEAPSIPDAATLLAELRKLVTAPGFSLLQLDMVENLIWALEQSFPARAAEPPQPASVGGVESRDLAEICRYVGVPFERARALFGVLAMVAPSEPAEPPHPSNEELVATVRGVCRLSDAGEAALSELERRLTGKT